MFGFIMLTVNSSENVKKTTNVVSEQKIQAQIEKLKIREQEVKLHESAHVSIGGQYAGMANYEYTTGPDGKKYITGGEVSIDVSEEKKPEDTIKKMVQVKKAALAPAEPSDADRNIAAKANQIIAKANAEILKKYSENSEKTNNISVYV